LLVDNGRAIAEQRIDDIKERAGVFELLSSSVMNLEDIHTLYSKGGNAMHDFQIMCYRKERRDIINGVFMQLCGFPASRRLDRLDCLHTGMKITFTKNLSRKMFSVENGNCYVICAIWDTRMTLGEWQLRRAMCSLEDDLQHTTRHDPEDDKKVLYVRRPSTDVTVDGRGVHRIIECVDGDKDAFCFDFSSDLLPHLRPGYAITTHGMQSAAAKHAILWDDDKFPPLTNEFVETARGRAIKRFTYIAESSDPRALFMKAVRLREPRRRTMLAEMIGDAKCAADWRPTIRTRCIECSAAFLLHPFALLDQGKHAEWPRQCPTCLTSATIAMSDE
jgi:hypothetical protein